MLRTVTTYKAALLGGAFALAAALPSMAVMADEPVRLDQAQLDSVTAAAAAGIGLFGEGESFGTLFSQSTTTFAAQGQSSPAFSTASGSITQFNIGIGGTGANTPTAVAVTGVDFDATEGDRLIIVPVNRSGSGRGFAWHVSHTTVVAYSSEFPL
jgi:hypothetical protein